MLLTTGFEDRGAGVEVDTVFEYGTIGPFGYLTTVHQGDWEDAILGGAWRWLGGLSSKLVPRIEL